MQFTNLKFINPFDLFPGFRELVELTGLVLPAEPTEEFFQLLHKAWGGSKVYADSIPNISSRVPLDSSGVPTTKVLDLLENTGLLNSCPLVSVAGRAQAPKALARMLAVGAIANWTTRRISHGMESSADGRIVFDSVSTLAGDRVCDTPGEQKNQAVLEWLEQRIGKPYYPTELELARFFVAMHGFDPGKAYVGPDLKENAARFARDVANRELFESRKPIYVPLQAGSYAALDIREGIRTVRPEFDENGDQLFWSWGSFNLARTKEQMGNAKEFQNPITMFQIIVALVHGAYKVSHPPTAPTAFNA